MLLQANQPKGNYWINALAVNATRVGSPGGYGVLRYAGASLTLPTTPILQPESVPAWSFGTVSAVWTPFCHGVPLGQGSCSCQLAVDGKLTRLLCIAVYHMTPFTAADGHAQVTFIWGHECLLCSSDYHTRCSAGSPWAASRHSPAPQRVKPEAARANPLSKYQSDSATATFRPTQVCAFSLCLRKFEGVLGRHDRAYKSAPMCVLLSAKFPLHLPDPW